MSDKPIEDRIYGVPLTNVSYPLVNEIVKEVKRLRNENKQLKTDLVWMWMYTEDSDEMDDICNRYPDLFIDGIPVHLGRPR